MLVVENWDWEELLAGEKSREKGNRMGGEKEEAVLNGDIIFISQL